MANYVSYEQIYGVPISPAGSRLGAWISAGDVETFRLLKLHGSLNWRYSGSISAQGETIYDSGLPKTWSGDRPTDRMTRAAQDKVPFIVPPTAVKSGFFSNETVRAQWLAARRELARADRVFCIGYSMPPTDQMMATMLADTTRGKQVSVIDRSAATIDRYRATLRAASAVSLAAAGESAVQDFVRGYDGSEWTVPESITV